MSLTDNKLLITLGDSWTYGVGSYNQELLKKYEKIDIEKNEEVIQKLYMNSLEDFKENSWPTIFSQLNDMKLINLSSGGESNIGQIKKLYEMDIIKLNQKHQHITAIYIPSIPSRLGFYSNGLIESYQVSDTEKSNMTDSHEIKNHSEFMKYYIDNIVVEFSDLEKELLYCLNSYKYFCEYHNIKWFFGFSYFHPTNIFNSFGHIDRMLNYYDKSQEIKDYGSYLSSSDFAWCGHPNKDGYMKIAKLINEIYTNKFLKKETII